MMCRVGDNTFASIIGPKSRRDSRLPYIWIIPRPTIRRWMNTLTGLPTATLAGYHWPWQRSSRVKAASITQPAIRRDARNHSTGPSGRGLPLKSNGPHG